MPVIELPDGSKKSYEAPLTVLEVAGDIGAGLHKQTVAGELNGKLVDACSVISEDTSLKIITPRDEAGVEIIRHSCAHLLGHALKQLYPEAQMVIGPIIKDGFYYDIAYPQAFHPDDLKALEERMYTLARSDYDVIKKMTPRKEVIDIFNERNEAYKLRLIEDMPEETHFGLYYHQEYVDMCRGPHVPNTRFLKSFHLTHLAGAYWRGDAKNEMLQRIYGTAWADKKSLQAHVDKLAEAEKRDHRRLGKQLSLFHVQEEAPGMAFWHPRGWTLYHAVEAYMRTKQIQHGYQEIRTPLILDRNLWEQSGHWEKFSDHMFVVASEHRDYALKPMNCPAHVQVFRSSLKSYRDLPVRYAEFGACHRNEPSGTLQGLMRVRQFTQDDAHIFCTEEQIQSEVSNFINMVFEVYADFGFDRDMITIYLSTRPDQRVGSDAMWDKSEQALQHALESLDLNWQLCPGEGAFYGPKIEFSLQDCLERQWQCGTIQVDFALPQRLDASYVSKENQKLPVVMLHRAVLGSFERFIGILIEHYAGVFPLWLAPVQGVVISITDKHKEYALKVQQIMNQEGFRIDTDLRNEKIGLKIREHTLQKIPYILVVGDKEVATDSVAVRSFDEGDQGSCSLVECGKLLKMRVNNKS